MLKLITILAISLLSVTLHAQSRLVFTYDASGNQIERTFVSGTSAKQLTKLNDITTTISSSSADTSSTLAHQITVYPNPTKGILRLEWLSGFTKQIQRITVSQLSGITWEVPLAGREENFVEVDLTQNANGVYIVNFELIDNDVVTKKIIKN